MTVTAGKNYLYQLNFDDAYDSSDTMGYYDVGYTLAKCVKVDPDGRVHFLLLGWYRGRADMIQSSWMPFAEDMKKLKPLTQKNKEILIHAVFEGGFDGNTEPQFGLIYNPPEND
jgi:hypothetical protein